MQAEGLVEYMITDLKDKLEPVGRLDVLDSIGTRAVEYYDAQDIEKLPDDSLSRQARARQIIGEVALESGEIARAQDVLSVAKELTRGIYIRNPNDQRAIFAHAQSEYWIGKSYTYVDDFEAAIPHFEIYAKFSDDLYKLDPSQYSRVMEKGWGENNLGFAYFKLENLKNAEEHFSKAEVFFEEAARIEPKNLKPKFELANVLGGLAQVKINAGSRDEALSFRNQQIEIYNLCLAQQPDNFVCRFEHVQAMSRLVTEGLLTANPSKLNKTIDTSVSEYEVLVSYEPDNRTWKAEYYLFLKEFLTLIGNGELEFEGKEELETRFTELREEVSRW